MTYGTVHHSLNLRRNHTYAVTLEKMEQDWAEILFISWKINFETHVRKQQVLKGASVINK